MPKIKIADLVKKPAAVKPDETAVVAPPVGARSKTAAVKKPVAKKPVAKTRKPLRKIPVGDRVLEKRLTTPPRFERPAPKSNSAPVTFK